MLTNLADNDESKDVRVSARRRALHLGYESANKKPVLQVADRIDVWLKESNGRFNRFENLLKKNGIESEFDDEGKSLITIDGLELVFEKDHDVLMLDVLKNVTLHHQYEGYTEVIEFI